MELSRAPSVIGFLPEENAILLSEYSPYNATIAVDAITGEEIWQFKPVQSECMPVLPIASNGALACEGEKYRLKVYRPVSSEELRTRLPPRLRLLRRRRCWSSRGSRGGVR